MAEIGATAALLLAFVFAVAGAAKLLDREATARSFESLRLPLPSLAAVVLPAVEIALAVTLVLAPRPGGIAALFLLSGFSWFLTRAVASGTTAGCACFGAARRQPVSFVEVVRNGLLAIAAAAAVAAPEPRGPTLAAVVTVSVAATAGLVVLALCELRRTTGRVWGTEPVAPPAADRAR